MSQGLGKVSDNARKKRESEKPLKKKPERRYSDLTPPSFFQDQEKDYHHDLHRRISSFVGHHAYEESNVKESVDRPAPTTSQTQNLATNYLAGKRNLTEGHHDKIYKWMGLASETDMRVPTKDEDKTDTVRVRVESGQNRKRVQRSNTVIPQIKPTIKVRSGRKTEK